MYGGSAPERLKAGIICFPASSASYRGIVPDCSARQGELAGATRLCKKPNSRRRLAQYCGDVVGHGLIPSWQSVGRGAFMPTWDTPSVSGRKIFKNFCRNGSLPPAVIRSAGRGAVHPLPAILTDQGASRHRRLPPRERRRRKQRGFCLPIRCRGDRVAMCDLMVVLMVEKKKAPKRLIHKTFWRRR